MRRWRVIVPALAALAALSAAVAWLWPPTSNERAGWLADYEALKQQTSGAYANLGERLSTRAISPHDLDARTHEALLDAKNVDEARAALQAFAAMFDDNHFRVRAPPGTLRRWLLRLTGGSSAGAEPLPPALPGAEACARMGYSAKDNGEIAWSALPGFQALGGGTAECPFPAGLVKAGEPPAEVAVLRIPSFKSEAYPALCAARWEEYRRKLLAACDEDCQGDFALEVERALLDRLASQIEALRRAGAGALLVDITANGGGSSVADPMAREVTAIQLREPELGFLRHPHWETSFAAARDAFSKELARSDLTADQRALLESARDRAEAMRVEAARRCDLSDLWTQKSPELPCEPVVRFPGFLRYARPGELDGLKTKGRLFNPSQYPYREGIWTGRLFVLVDRWTASAAEGFAALLRDNGAAIVLGERTLGSGCGYTNGGVTLNLPHTGLSVRTPDCVRFRTSGHSEAEGITPDIDVPWSSGDDGATRAIKVLVALPHEAR